MQALTNPTSPSLADSRVSTARARVAHHSEPHRAVRLRSVPRPGVRSLLLLANGNASGVIGSEGVVERAGRLLRSAGARVDTLLTSSLAELEESWPADPERRVVLLGGDGTIHAAANLPGPHPELAVLPVGGANNVAASLGIPTDLREAVALAVGGAAHSLDLIAARSAEGSYLAVEGVSVGFLALARSRYSARNSTDLRAGLTAGLATLARFQPLCVGIEEDGVAAVHRISQVFVANLPRYGPGLRVAPGADPADGMLDLVVIETEGRRALPPLLARLRHGSHIGRAGVRLTRARRVRIVTGGRSPVIADSTGLGTGPVELEVVPHALRIVWPSR